MKKIVFIALFIVLPGLFDSVHAQHAELSEESTISLITILPGDAAEELFGHSAVRINDPQNNIDISFNYGTFEFDTFFLAKFIYGDLNYFLSVAPYHLTYRHYRNQGRPMIEQVLNLSASQKQDIYEFLEINAKEENRYYQYDFLYDNCSTRIRDAFESVLGDNLQFTEKPAAEITFREMIHLYVDHRSFIHLGIDLLLGRMIDHPVTSRETMFLPDFLMEEFDTATVQIDGETRPLVKATERVLHIEDYGSNGGVPIAVYLTWALFLIGLGITYKNIHQKKSIERWFDIPLFTVIGLIGLLITFLWFISLHSVTAQNLNLFWAWPTHLLLIPFFYRRSIMSTPIMIYLAVSALASIGILIGWTFWQQDLHIAIIPILLLLALRGGYIAYVALDESESSMNK